MKMFIFRPGQPKFLHKVLRWGLFITQNIKFWLVGAGEAVYEFLVHFITILYSIVKDSNADLTVGN